MIEDMAAAIKLLVLDVDGVMTDGRILLTGGGEEIKCFHVRDGLGLKLLMEAGIDVAIITGRASQAVLSRARELGITEVHQGIRDKAAIFSSLVKNKGLEKEQVCAMGDDLPELAVFRLAGLSVAVGDAAVEVREAASMVTRHRGGMGAVREVCELILKAQGKWSPLLYCGERGAK